jgi:hypothetical protein
MLPTLLASISAAPGNHTNSTVCWKDTYERGVGTVPESCKPGHERGGALCYPLCKAAEPKFDGIGPVCWQECRTGYVDEGALCRKDKSIVTYAKDSYGRGAGVPLSCRAGLVNDAALCYPPCRSSFDGVGPVCWDECLTVHGNDTINGGALCCRSKDVCTKEILDLSLGLPLEIAAAFLAGGNVTKIEEDAIKAIEDALGFVMPICSELPPVRS